MVVFVLLYSYWLLIEQFVTQGLQGAFLVFLFDKE
jgi:hypothetical protein